MRGVVLAAALLLPACYSLGDDGPFPCAQDTTCPDGYACQGAASSGFVCMPAKCNLLSYWTGDGTTDDEVGGRDLASNGGVTYGPGVHGQAFVFAQPMATLTSDSDGLPEFTSRTISFWARIDQVYTADIPFIGYGEYKASPYPHQGFSVGAFEDSSGVYAFAASREGITGPFSGETLLELPLGGWHQVTVTMRVEGGSTGYAYVYIDDKLAGYAPNFDAQTYTGGINPLVIGSLNTQAQFIGAIDELMIYDCELPPAGHS